MSAISEMRSTGDYVTHVASWRQKWQCSGC